jgi:ABC-type transporter Mla subunit MlaD
MADLSFSFDPTGISDAVSKGTDALSKISTKSAVWDSASDAASKAGVALSDASDAKSAASDAVSKIATVSDAASKAMSRANSASDAASDAISKIAAVSDAASNALSKVGVVEGDYIKSIPGAGSFAVHEIMRTSAGLVKFVYSSAAA